MYDSIQMVRLQKSHLSFANKMTKMINGQYAQLMQTLLIHTYSCFGNNKTLHEVCVCNYKQSSPRSFYRQPQGLV